MTQYLYDGWQVVIGLEIHAQLNTESKMFSHGPVGGGEEPNTAVAMLDMAMPGVLPTVNKQALEKAMLFALATGGEVAKWCRFDRKNYFYPDLPKGYQTSQLYHPICLGGEVVIRLSGGNTKNPKTEPSTKTIRLHHAHLEEDAGKSLHDLFPHKSAIDLNRAGTPLLEIVSEPDMSHPDEAVSFAKQIHNLVESIGICDGDLSQGHLRFDANVSLKKPEDKQLGTRAEIKNLNSFRFLQKALWVEIERQKELLETGGKVVQQTRLYNPTKNETQAMRSKEEANDYRYFPCPDLMQVCLSADWVREVQLKMPELPQMRQERFVNDFGLSDYDASVLVSDKKSADYFEQCLDYLNKANKDTTNWAKLCCNWVLGELAFTLNQEELDASQAKVSPEQMAKLLINIENATISGTLAKQVFEQMWNEGGDCDEVIEKSGLKQISDDSSLEKIVDEILSDNPSQVEQYQLGKDRLFGFFVGQGMKKTQGKANPQKLNQILKNKLKP